MFSKTASKSFPEISFVSPFQRSYVDAHVWGKSYWHFERDSFFPTGKVLCNLLFLSQYLSSKPSERKASFSKVQDTDHLQTIAAFFTYYQKEGYSQKFI